MTSADRVTAHYSSTDIARRVLETVRRVNGADAPVTPDAFAPLDHFHGRGLQATKELVALLNPQRGESILDIGGGIGGPARWIAWHFECHVTTIDLTPEFCRAAEELSAATAMTGRVRVVEGSATELPFTDDEFDRAYSENVAMNIPDKRTFYAEAFRVIRPGGVFAFSNYGSGARGDPYYPAPWAANAGTSFLSTLEQTKHDLAAAGFEIITCRDKTAEVLPDLEAARARLEREGLPALGLHVLMGDRQKDLQINVARSVEEGRLTVIEALVRKPA